MINLSLIALGGAFGSVLRYLAVSALGAPWAVMGVNILGSFAIGVAFVALAPREGLALFVMTGVLGGFTTFSALSLDALKLWQAGQAGLALIYIGGSVILSLLAVYAGVSIAKGLGL